MICMTVTFTIAEGHEQAAMKLLRKLVQHARKEPGVLVSQAYRSRREPRRYFVYLQFTDLAAADTHRGGAYYGEYVLTNLYGMLESDGPTIETYEPLFERETLSQ
jgi:quinol monooxygenase YgiN